MKSVLNTATRRNVVAGLAPVVVAARGWAIAQSADAEFWLVRHGESFFHTLKTEQVHHRVYATRAEARCDLFGYIEGFYNSRRLYSALGYISPAEMERRAAKPFHFLGEDQSSG